MKYSPTLATAVVVMAAAVATSCRTAPADSGPRLVQPGTPGAASRVLPAEGAVFADLPHVEADVRFMQGMISHHAQALALTALVEERTTRTDVRLLARRIELSQIDEIELMRSWLEERGEVAPEVSLDHMSHLTGHEDAFMPGMLTHDDMDRLAASSGPDFEALFIEYMIRHHEGALRMVHDLFSTPGAALGDDINQFALHVEADQAIEIRRMRAMPSARP